METMDRVVSSALQVPPVRCYDAATNWLLCKCTSSTDHLESWSSRSGTTI